MNPKYKCIIVEDEELLAGVLKVYLEHFDELELVAICSDAIQANKVLQQHKIDLLFLDIQMPYITGVDFLKSLEKPPFTIFTTAYSEHAIDGFNLNAIDYLLKPIKLTRFLVAVNKFLEAKKQQSNTANSHQIPKQNPTTETITFKCNGNWVKLNYSEITYIESLREYVRFWTSTGEKYVVLKSLTALENELPPDSFIRIHRSFIVRKSAVKKVSGNQVYVLSTPLSLSNSYKKVFFEWFFG